MVSNRGSKFIMGLDIGSTKICACICEISPYGEIQVRGTGIGSTQGLQKGKITNSDDLRRSIEKAIQRAELSAGARVDQVMTNLPMYNTRFLQNVGVIISKEESGKISDAEKLECLRRSKNVEKAADQTVIHMIPLYYKVDEMMVQNPVGIKGTHLEAKTHIVVVDSDTLNKTTLLLKGLRLHITGIVYDALASAQSILSENELKNGAIVIDMGGRFTKVSIFKNHLLHRSLVIPIGGETLTQDIAQCLAVSVTEAERLKVLYGNVNHLQINPGEYIDITTKDGKKPIQRRLLCNIINARMVEWMTLIKADMSFDFDPHYHIFLSGKGATIAGMDRFVESALDRRVITQASDKLRHSAEGQEHASALGLVIYGLKSKAIPLSPPPQTDPFNRINSWIKEFF